MEAPFSSTSSQIDHTIPIMELSDGHQLTGRPADTSQPTIGRDGNRPRQAPGRGRGRRASLVIDETRDLLSGLAEDQARSANLMAELEAMLASSASVPLDELRPVSMASWGAEDGEPEMVEVDEFGILVSC